jgi:hypothetical protein
LQTIDGIALAAGDRVLVHNQGTGNESQHGVYLVAAGAWTLAADSPATDGTGDGSLVPVARGTAYRDTVWQFHQSGLTYLYSGSYRQGVGCDPVANYHLAVGPPTLTSGDYAALIRGNLDCQATDNTIGLRPGYSGAAGFIGFYESSGGVPAGGPLRAQVYVTTGAAGSIAISAWSGPVGGQNVDATLAVAAAGAMLSSASGGPLPYGSGGVYGVTGTALGGMQVRGGLVVGLGAGGFTGTVP